MGLLQGSDYKNLQQALGPDCKSALGCDVLMCLHVNHTSGIDSAMCGSCSRIMTWTETMRNMQNFEFLSAGFISVDLELDSRLVRPWPHQGRSI